ncbi:hypothetical protein MNBD_GAMMA10-1791 [hydrothermal vent metagenome]|uniref:Type II secretion system protein GspI C-terminal domain-containing protein n=1 Tax=hydrothermal vent metagenome TaxID=652676 RepID=A0A3B0YM67_9ZZZZ
MNRTTPEGSGTTSICGFTLIEVMVALSIIAIALSSLIKASGSHTSTAAYLKSKTLAHYVAMNEIADLQTKRSWPDMGSSEGSAEMAGFEWFWTREVASAGDETGNNIRSMKFTVYGNEDRSRGLAQVRAFISNPANNQPTVINNGNQASNPGGANQGGANPGGTPP